MKSLKKIIILSFLGLFFLSFLNIGTAIENSNLQILSVSSMNQWQEIGNNTRMNITAGQRHQFRTQNRNQIRLQVNQSAELKINETEVNPAEPLPNQTRAVNRYMQLELNCTCEMNATLFRNFTNSELMEFGDTNTFRWAFFNTTRNQWQYAEQNWVEHTADGASVFCNTTHFSIWTILAPELEMDMNPTPGSPFQAQNGTGFAVQAGNRYQIQTQSGFELQLQLNENAELTITEYDKSPKAMNQEKHQIRTKTMSIELNTTAEIQATFSYTFTNQIRSQLGVKNLEQLRFMFYNETTNSWEVAKNQWFDGETLYCNTTHFSLWTIAEEEVVVANNTPGFTAISTLLMVVLIPIIKRRK
ncbi:MAG: hypothetical protein ACTSR2_07665 [Candidatus Hodarchaeales archaeon]